MSRCGCSTQCTCQEIGRYGHGISGNGSQDNPYVHRFDPRVDSILGPGMEWQEGTKKLLAKISTDGGNTLTYGTDDGLYDSGGAAGEGGYATVDGLVAQTSAIVGGSYGAGFAQWPEGDIKPYRTAMDMELPLIHVPVRRGGEQFLFAQHYRDLGNYNPFLAGATVDTIDLNMAEIVNYQPAGPPHANVGGDWRNPVYTAQAGYFGYNKDDTRGVPRVSDVFELTQRRTVLYLQVKDLGLSASDTPLPLDTFRQLRLLVKKYGLQKSVIVGSEWAAGTANSTDLDSTLAGLALLRDEGCAIALHLTSKAQVDAVPPANLITNGFTWVFISLAVADAFPASVKAYKDAGIHVMLFTGCRRWHYELITNTVKFGAGGLKGGLFSDPVYAAGVTNNYRYREDNADWGWSIVDYGSHAYTDSIPWMRDRFRGYIDLDRGGQLALDGDVLLPSDTDPSFRTSGYFRLQGEQLPAPNYNPANNTSDNYDIHVGFLWDAIVADPGRWMSCWFGNPEDRELYEWRQANQFTRGHTLQLDLGGNFVLQRYDGIPWSGSGDPFQYSYSWPSPWAGGIQAGVEYRVQIRVRPGKLVLGPVGQNEGDTHTRTFGVDTPTAGARGDLWRGPHVYLGRHFFSNTLSAKCRWVWFICRPA